jgi:DNA polymerase III psi subunit
MHRSVAEQIEHWARLGKVAEENRDLPIPMLQDMLVSMEEAKAGNLSRYQFR